MEKLIIVIGLVPKFCYGFNYGIGCLDVLSLPVSRSVNNTIIYQYGKLASNQIEHEH